MHGRVADPDRAQLRDEPLPGRDDLAHDWRLGQRRLVGRPALRLDPALPHRVGRAVGDRGLGAAAALGRVDPEIGEREQPGARVEHELREVGRAVTAHRVARLLHLERVADGGAERLVHVGEQADDLAARLLAEREHRLGEPPRIVERLHERAVADLDVEHDRLRAARELLRHDRRRDQRELVDGRRHVAQAVEQLVGGYEIARLADDRAARRRAPAATNSSSVSSVR